MSDPEEQLYFDLPENSHPRVEQDQLDDEEEESFCQMLDQTEKRTGYKFGDGYKFIRKRVSERKKKRLSRKSSKKSEVSPETVESVEIPEDGEEESEENFAINDEDDE